MTLAGRLHQPFGSRLDALDTQIHSITGKHWRVSTVRLGSQRPLKLLHGHGTGCRENSHQWWPYFPQNLAEYGFISLIGFGRGVFR
jgi:hypothetical protein